MSKYFVVSAVSLAALLSSCAGAATPDSNSKQAAPATTTVVAGDRTSGESKTPLLLAEGGKALLPIVVSPKASETVKGRAAFLAAKLGKITGATFAVTVGDGATGIVVGTWPEFPVPALKKPLEIRQTVAFSHINNGIEAYAIQTEAKRLLLLGGGEKGTAHAVARFLELVGYRQFYPSPAWEVVPSVPTLRFRRNETDRPTIPVRQMWFSFNVAADAPNETNQDQNYYQRSEHSRTELAAWAAQNRLGESYNLYNAHNYYHLTHGINEAEFAAHPEYYGLIDGKRVPDTICDSNPNVRRLAGEMAVWYLKKYAAAGEMFSMEPHDGDAMCQCEKCRAVGTYSDRAFDIANSVARVLQKELPGKMVGMLAYNNHDVPPKFAIEPNVHVSVARLFIKGPYPFQELVRMWRQKTPNIGVYEYWSTYQHGQDRLRAKVSAGPTGDLAGLTDSIRRLAKSDLLSLSSESSVAWGGHGRGNYLAAKLMWNPGADVDATLHDFYVKAFGPAAPAMKRYFERVDGENEQFSTTLLGLAMRDVAEANTLAQGRPDVLARIAEIKQFLYYNYLQYRNLTAKDSVEGKPWELKILQHEYRARGTYMTHWNGTEFYLKDTATQYKAPEWNFATPEEIAAAKKEGKPFPTPPWQIETNYTPEETDANFKEALEFFQPTVLLPAVKYSDDLVAIDWGVKTVVPDYQVAEFRRGAVYLYSPKGAPLNLDLIGSKSETAAFYVLSDKAGKELVRGTFPADDAKHPVSFKVPAAGLYTLKVTAPGWWLYAPSPTMLNTLVLADQQEISGWTYLGAEGKSFFYVPKGTKSIQFFWGGLAHKIFDAEGTVVSEVPEMSDYFTVAVPDGKDGTIWSFNGRHQPRQFVNIPNTIAPSPQSLMIPRELAVKDGLKILK